ncbi:MULTISPECIES: PAS domain S-box protein [unclassified Nodularia (in: cyanobacteria)]|uniref:PAS domain S-box protein n=1 Tax=unclassified Nodularia (in: cyanobacteria) TaxID=2656917 RepID=UPI001D11D28B|nr:PAS domain S-box protein [Nodularia sp. LEGE 06071]
MASEVFPVGDKSVEERLTAILENMAEAFMEIDTAWRVTSANHQATQLLNKNTDDLCSKLLWDVFPVEATTQFYQQCHQVIVEKICVEFEEFYPALNRWLKVRLCPSGNSLLTYFLDITERKELEITLRQKQDFLTVLLDNVQAGIVACDAEGRLQLFNKTAQSLHGLSEKPLFPEEWAEHYDLYLPDGKTLMETADIPLFQALQGQQVDNVEMIIMPKQGVTRILSAKGQAIVDWHGEKQGAVVVMHDITERKQAEEALRKTEQRYRSVVDHVKEVIFQIDAVGVWTFLNPAWTEITGFSVDESICTHFLNYVYPDDRQHNLELFQSLMQREKDDCHHEIRYLTKTGGFRWIEVFAHLNLDDDGTILGTSGTLIDITERKQAEAKRVQLAREQVALAVVEVAHQQSSFLAEISAVLASSLDYQQTLQSVANLVVPYFADWCCVDLLNDDLAISRVAVAHADAEKVGLGWEVIQLYPNYLDDGYGISQVMKTGQSQIVVEITDEQLVATIQDPQYLQLLRELSLKSCIIVPLKARERVFGSISFIFAESHRHYSMTDLTLAEDLARRAANAIDNAYLYHEAQLARQAAEKAADLTARLQTVTAALCESLTPLQVAEVIVEQSMTVLAATSAMVVLVSKDRQELEIIKAVGYNPDLLESWHKFSINSATPLAEAIRTEAPIWLETSAERIASYPHLAEVYDQYDFQSWVSLPLVTEGRSVGGISLNFRELKHLSQDDREFILALCRQCAQAIARSQLYEAESQARAEAEQANRIKDEFLAVLSHELRSPLNPILGWTKILRTKRLDAAKTTQALETIERNAKLQAQLIEDLLDVSRILQGKITLNVAPVNLATTIKAALETVQLAAEVKNIHIHTQFNLTSGNVSGDSNRLQQVFWNLFSNAVKFTPSGGRVEVQLEQVGMYAQIQVKDTGKGITPEFLPYVFEYFRQEDGATTRKFGGLGLGLAIVRNLTELHGGTVHADSPGQNLGTTFIVRLPLNLAEQQLSSDHSHLETLIDLTGIQILVVDDDPDMRELVEFILVQAGAQVSTAASALQALTLLNQSIPDLLLSDIGMPEMDGYSLIRQIRKYSPPEGGTIPAIALSAYAGEINQQQALQAGFHKHISKPIEPEELVRAIALLITK